jgi:asparaginyl-tRNA synthetase
MRQKINTLGKEQIGQDVEIKGWVRTARNQKTFTFLQVNDGSNLKGLQVIVDSGLSNYNKISNLLTTGCSIAVTGTLVESPASGQPFELQAKEVEVIGVCDPETYPLQKKKHTFEFLRTIAHLRPRTNTLGAVARVRNALAFATHKFFQEKAFLYVQTPIITASDCEGAGQMFRVTTLDPQKVPKTEKGDVDWSKDFFEKPAYLTVSGQLNGEIYACALGDIYTFGPTFRAENSNTSRHLAEFWMIEPEMAFADLNDNLDLAEGYLKYVIKYVLENCQGDMEFFDEFVNKGIVSRLQQIVNTSFERASYTYAVRILEKSGKTFAYPIRWGADLQSEHERYLAEEYFSKPVMLTDFPKNIKPFYMRLNEDQKTVAAMDALLPGLGEVIGGSQREDRIDVLEQRIKETGMKPDDYWWYMELRKFGSVPHAGFGVGFERLVQFTTGMDNIRDAIAFPRIPGKADF